MKKKIRKLYTVLMALFIPACLLSQYSDHNIISQKAASMSREYSGLCKTSSLVKTAGGKDIWLITIGKGDRDNKPAVAILGGIEGNYLLGRELALGFAAEILRQSSDPEIAEILEKITFYIMPDVSPDASEQYFSQLKYDRTTNNRPDDDDRDFLVDEDSYEDLNNDGFLTLLRIADPSGKYIESADDNRIMVLADLSKGQTGNYHVFTEGIDNDKDGCLNEDVVGGVNFNRNFTYNYEEFGKNAGPYPISEPESKAVADFLYDHFNIFATVAFGPQDNLGLPPEIKDDGDSDAKQIDFQEDMGYDIETDHKPNVIKKSDAKVIKLVSDRYHELTGAKGAPRTIPASGNFADWSYFHYGRYSFSTPGWWFPLEKDDNPEASFLKYAGPERSRDIFVPWTEINHPDFPDKKAEIGGIKPFVLINPPADAIEALVKSHYRFIVSLASLHPELEFLDEKTEKIAGGLYRVSLKIHNKGVFATGTKAAERNIWTRVMRLSIRLSDGQSVVSGLKVQRINRLQGDESAEFSWLISGKGQLEITAGAVNTGNISKKLEIR